jgi:nitroreductase
MDLYQLMKKRHSVRTFSTKNFSKEKLNRIIKSAYTAPSGANQKPYKYIIVETRNIKEKIKKFCEQADEKYYQKSSESFKKWIKNKKISLKKDFLVDAPYLIVVAGDKDKPYWKESTWISIGFFVLAVEYEKLSTLTYTPGETDFLKKLLNLEKNFEPVVILPVGFEKK